MSDAPTTPLLKRLWLRLLATAGVAAAVLVTWWGKIEDARVPKEPPAATFGTPVDLGRTKLTPTALSWTETPGKPVEIVLSGVMENVTGSSQRVNFSLAPKLLELSVAGEALLPPEAILLRDQDTLLQLEPRLAESVELIWTAPEGMKRQEITLVFGRETFKLRDNLFGKSSWLGIVPQAQMTALPKLAAPTPEGGTR